MRDTIHYSILLLLVLATSVASAQSDMDAVVAGNNQFALDLYGQIAGGEDGNLFLSPFSISTALAMTYAGARENTAVEMADVLQFTLSPEQLHPAFGELINALNDEERAGYELHVANRLWGQQGYGFLPEFLATTADCYGAELAEVDYIGHTEEARVTINQWVEDQTHQKIKDLIREGLLTPDTRLVLTNAIYFNGTWKYEFDPEFTEPASFWISSSDQIDVSMMHQTAEYRYGVFDDFQMIELPYTEDELSMIAILPNERDGLGELEAWLSAETLTESLDQLNLQEVDLFLPKFEITSEFGLKDALASMGMVDAFTHLADFSGMNGQRDLFISEVVHKAYASVNEEGTEAAAATGVVMELTSVGPYFYADHPFLILIQDNLTQSILFLGRIVEPEGATASSEFLPGDIDHDGDVDCQDFLAWKDGFGALDSESLSAGDADGDGDVDGSDFLAWQNHFANSQSASSIPEPSGSILLLVLLATWTIFQTSRRG